MFIYVQNDGDGNNDLTQQKICSSDEHRVSFGKYAIHDGFVVSISRLHL